MQIYDFISYRKQNKQYFHFRFLKIFPFTLFCTFHTDVRPLVANNYLQSEKDSGSWARDMVGALKTGDLEQFCKLLTSFLTTFLTSCVARKPNVSANATSIILSIY